MADDLKLNFVLGHVTVSPVAEEQPLPSCSPSELDLKRCFRKMPWWQELTHRTGCIIAVYLLSNAALTRKKMPGSVYLHIKGLACQQLQIVDKGFLSPVISWFCSMVLLSRKWERREGN